MTLQNDLLNDPALCSNIIPRNICDIPQNYPHKRGYNTLLYLSLKLNQKTNKKLNQNQKNQKTNKNLIQTTSYGGGGVFSLILFPELGSDTQCLFFSDLCVETDFQN